MAIAQNFPEIAPSLNLSFALTKALDPRVTFSRASSATYYGTETAKAEENLFSYSQEFDDGVWSKQNLTITANATSAPDGTTTAEKLVENTANASHRLTRNINVTASTEVVYSVFAKADTRDFIALSPSNPGVANHITFFDLANGVVGTNAAGNTASIEDVGNGWYRCIVKRTTTNTQTLVDTQIYIVSANNTTTYTGDGTSGLFLWGAQLEQRSAVTAYTPTTDQPITRFQPVLESEPAGVARFDHDPLTFESLGLLVEEQRTNLLLRSEEFDNAGWGKTNSTITANTIVAPSGELTGDKHVPNSGASIGAGASQTRLAQGNYSRTAGGSFTATAYAKRGELNSFRIADIETGNNKSANYNLVTGVASVVGGTATASMTPVGNDWYRCVLTWVQAITESQQTRFTAFDTVITTGDGFSGVFIWGAQLEEGAFPTSYIKTEASQVTRSADSASMTGANFSSWFNQEQGAIYCEYKLPTVLGFGSTRIFSINDNTFANTITLRTQGAGSNQLRPELLINNTSFAMNYSVTGLGFSVFNKTLLGFKLGDNRSVTNGTISATQGTLLPLNPMNRLDIGMAHTSAGQISGHIKKLSYYPQRLTDTAQDALTS